METAQLQIGKYIIVDNHPILFPIELAHSQVAGSAQSAGFFALRFSGSQPLVSCWGESISLNLKSNELTDAAIIRNFISRIISQASPVPQEEPAAVLR